MGNKSELARPNGATENQKSDFGAKGWFLVLFCMFLYFLGSGASADGLNVIVPAFVERFGWNPATLFSFATVGGWCGIVGAMIFGVIAEKKGARVVIVSGLITGCVGLLIWSFTTSLFWFAVATALANVSMNGFMICGTSTLAAKWFPRKKGLFMGWITMGANLATALYVHLFRGIRGIAGSISTAFIVMVAIYVLMMVVTLVFVRNNPEEAGCFPDNDKTMTREEADRLFQEGEEYARTSPWTTARLLRSKTVWLISLSYGIIVLITLGVIGQIVPTIMSFGYSEEYASILMTVCAVLGMVFSYLWGVLDGKIGTKRATAMFFVWTILALLFMVLPGSWILYVSVFFMGGFIGAGNNLTTSMVGTVFGRYDFSRAWSVILPITCLIRSCGYAIVAILADMTGNYTVSYIALALVALILLLRMDDTCVGRTTIAK
jgi:MFS family permease